MKRILINATHNEEIRVALCKDNHLYDFDLENRTREQKKANIYKGHITRVEPSLEAAFVEYGSARQGFLPLREIAPEYLHGNAREDNIKQLLKEGDEVIVQVEKEERGNKGAALSTYISLAGRYLVLMPNNAKAGGISRQISGKVREEMKQIISSLSIPKGMSVIVRTAGLGKGFDDLQNDLNHLLDIWASILDQNKKRPSPCLVHQEAGVVTRAVRDYLRDDIGEVWIDSEHAYNEAANFIAAVMPAQLDKLRKYTEYEPMFARFGIERQIETAYQREVRLPSGGSIVIDQTEAMVAIDINSSKSTKGSDVSETAYHTNLEAADEIARQLRLRDMGGLIVIDFIDMADPRHQKDVEKRLIDATRHDRARVQFAEISKFGLMEMSRQRLRPSLEEATGYICPRCHGNGMIRDLRSLALSIMRQIEQIALKERMGEIQAEVPTEIAAFLLNEKRESLVYLEQDSGTRITVLPHAHLESPNFSLHFNPDGFAPSSYERIVNAEEEEMIDRGYDVDWQTKQETIEPNANSRWQKAHSSDKPNKAEKTEKAEKPAQTTQPQVAAWLSNLFAPKPQAQLAGSLNSNNAAAAIESLVNAGNVSLGASGTIALPSKEEPAPKARKETKEFKEETQERRGKKKFAKKDVREDDKVERQEKTEKAEKADKKAKKEETYAKREAGSRREARGEIVRGEALSTEKGKVEKADKVEKTERQKERPAKSVGTDVVMHVSPAKSEEIAGSAVHISLDNSKPKKVAEPVAQETPKDAEPTISTNVQDESNARPAPQDSTDDTAKVVANAVQATDVETTQTVQTPEVASDDVVNDTVQDNKTQDDVAQTTSQDSTPAIDPARLSELARQMNKAINDPRVVLAAKHAPNVIAGTAGEFIERVLGADKGNDFVQNFILAIAKNQTPATEFSFANYGYAPLGEQYLAAFDKQTSVSSRISAPQGKTAAPAPRQTVRASNDPRGPLPVIDTTQETTVATAEVATPENDNAPTAEVADNVATETTTPAANTPSTDTADVINAVADKSMTDNATNEVAVDNNNKQSEGETSQADANTQDVAQAKTAVTPQSVQTDSTDTATPKPEKAKESGKKKGKTSANSYKDMIENVAGQLLPQVGILNLAQPKPAKTRIKKTSGKGDNKPKSEVRKAGTKVSKTKTETKKEPTEPKAE